MVKFNRHISRDQLYVEVWCQPISKLAPKYGISDVGLKKICRALNVPAPPRGYWAKVQNGIEVSKTPLPKLKIGQPKSYTIQKPESLNIRATSTQENVSNEARQIILELKDKIPLRVPKQLYNPHELVLKTKKSLTKAEINKYGLLEKWNKIRLDVRVGLKLLNRALRIMNTIIKFYEKHGIEVSAGKDSRDTHIWLFDEKISFYIREPTNRFDHVPTAKEAAEEKRRGWASYEKYDYIPSGKLSLEIDKYSGNGIKKRWTDGKKVRVENHLKDFIINSVIVADFDRTRRLKREEEYRRWEMERQRRAEIERLRQIEIERRRKLENQAENLSKSLQVKKLIEATITAASKKGISADSRPEYRKWLRWATAHADRLNPLKDRLPFESDYDDK
jgi:hypothetical protein